MDKEETVKATEAAIAVMNALQPLNSDERARVLQSAAALFGLGSGILLAPVTAGAPDSSGTANAEGNSKSTRAQDIPPTSSKPMSLVEFLKQKSPVTNCQRIACFAYYWEKYEAKSNFSKSDLSRYFAKAKLTAPGPNYTRDYNATVKQAWIHDDEANSYLTQEGERAVEAGFGGKRKSPILPSKRKSSKTK